ncbi:MAG: class I SAM-dependent methyltransferase, partial [Flavisolibacter sp.]|nr:class I SAM-dependent methyltransferase [Flavisolibacter sp.]
MTDSIANNEAKVEAAFSAQAKIFDAEFCNNPVIQYKRQRVRTVVETLVPQGSSILELNCGTGEDAVYFGSRGYQVLATDLSDAMVDETHQKIMLHELENLVTVRQLSFHNLDQLNPPGKFDLIFSNFGGLNCTGDLNNVLLYFDRLLNRGGVVTLVMMPGFCLWESLLLFKGEFKTATRRFFKFNGSAAIIEGKPFKCFYYAPSFITSRLKNQFEVELMEGL